MTVLDTHTWVWWVLDESKLGARSGWLDAQPTDALGISVMTIWEVAKLVQKRRLQLPISVREWTDRALDETAVEVIGIPKEIAIDANDLPGEFHSDPADQIIVATARKLGCDLMTADRRILSYAHVRTITF